MAHTVLASDQLHRVSHAFEDGARHFGIAELLKEFVGDVGRGQVRENQHVGRADEFHERVFFLNGGVEGGVALHGPVDHQRRVQRSGHDDRFLNAF